MRLRQKIQLQFECAFFGTLMQVDKGLHGTVIDIRSDQFAADPYERLQALRDKDPRHDSMAFRAWWVTGFDELQISAPPPELATAGVGS